MWVLTPRIERALSSFQHRVAQQLTGRRPRRQGGWELGLSIIGVSNDGGRLRGDRDIHHEEAENGRAVYCDATDYGPL